MLDFRMYLYCTSPQMAGVHHRQIERRPCCFLRTVDSPTCLPASIARANRLHGKTSVAISGWLARPVLSHACPVSNPNPMLQDSQGECKSHAHFWDRRTQKCILAVPSKSRVLYRWYSIANVIELGPLQLGSHDKSSFILQGLRILRSECSVTTKQPSEPLSMVSMQGL